MVDTMRSQASITCEMTLDDIFFETLDVTQLEPIGSFKRNSGQGKLAIQMIPMIEQACARL